jgi:hypothetical protein
MLQVAACCALLAPVGAHASVFDFSFAGPAVSGMLRLTYEANPNAGPLAGTSPNPYDPVGSYIVTAISGTFSNSNLGIVDAAVTGLVPVNNATPDPQNLRAPKSFSRFLIEKGVQSDQPGAPPAPGLSFDNLYYPGGSPQTSTDYPFSGGLFDIYGLMFTIQGDKAVNLWSNGVQPGAGLNYGVAVATRVELLDYTSGVSIAAVPEPAVWLMMIGGFGLVGATLRRRTGTGAQPA